MADDSVVIAGEQVFDARVINLRGTFPEIPRTDRDPRLFQPEEIRLIWNHDGLLWNLRAVEASAMIALSEELRIAGFKTPHVRKWHYPLVGDFGDFPDWLQKLCTQRTPATLRKSS